MKKAFWFLAIFFAEFFGRPTFAQTSNTVSWLESLCKIPRSEIRIYLKALENQKSLPDTIFGLSTSGEFTWSGFFLTLCEYQAAQNVLKTWDSIPEKKLLEWGRLCFLKDYQGTTFSQLYLLKSLSFFGKNLKENVLWKSFPDSLQKKFETIADIRKTYDPHTKTIANGKPNNYFGVACMLGSYAWHLGFFEDRKIMDDLLNHSLLQLQKNQGWLNDGKEGEFRFDRYHFEYVRFIWESAERMGRKDILNQMIPFLEQTDNLYLNCLHPVSGAAFPFGRSLQNIWEDNFEYIPFLIKRKGLKDKELNFYLEVFAQTSQFYFKNEYDTLRHHSRMLDPGRACYSYVKPNRIFGYSFHSLGKFFGGMHQLSELGIFAWENGKKAWKEFLHRNLGPPFFPLKTGYGIWLLRSENTRLIIPLVTGLGKPWVSDYQAIPLAEGFSQPPVSLASSHLLPVLKKRGKTYFPSLKSQVFPMLTSKNKFVLQSIHWVSKTDTLPVLEAPSLLLKYQFHAKDGISTLVANYQFQNSESSLVDSLIFSFWHSEPGPYLKSNPENFLNIEAPEFEKQRRYPLPNTEEGKGAFTPIPFRDEFFLAPKPGQKVNWNVTFSF